MAAFYRPHTFPPKRQGTGGNIIQIVTGIEVNSVSNFPKLREYCPSAEVSRLQVHKAIQEDIYC